MERPEHEATDPSGCLPRKLWRTCWQTQQISQGNNNLCQVAARYLQALGIEQFMQPIAQHWKDISREPLTIEAIRELHTPASHYRISPNNYTPGTQFPGTSKAGRIYVLSGSCYRAVGAWQVALEAGSFADFPAGDFEFKVLGKQPVKLVHVWPIKEYCRAKPDA